MNEKDWAERFNHDVNNLLKERMRPDAEPMPTEYQKVLDLARTLVETDFSTESRMREMLRRRLLNRIGTQETWSRQKESVMNALFWKRRPVLTLLTVVLAMLLLVSMTRPDALVVAAQEIADFVQSLRVGDYTSVHQVDPEWAATHPQREPPVTPEVIQNGDNWIVRTIVGNFGGNVSPGQDATVQHLDSIATVQAAAPFDLRLPEYLPDGYTFREAMVVPAGWTFLFYDGPNGDIILVEMLVYEQVEERAEGQTITVDTEVVSSVTITDKPIEEVNLNGRPAAWIEGEGLRWEADGLSYVLGGVNLSLEETLRIAESLE